MMRRDDPRVIAAFEDLSLRFFLNLPESEYANFNRLFFQLEKAHWFYIDHYCTPELKAEEPLPIMKKKTFCKMMFANCMILQPYLDEFDTYYRKFLEYYNSITVCGCMILNQKGTKVLVVKGTGSNYGFPRGKMDQNETHIQCAVREAKEEVGLNVGNLIDAKTETKREYFGKSYIMFIVPNVAENYPFEAQSDEEITDIKWISLSELSNRKKYYNASIFHDTLQLWVKKNIKKRSNSSNISRPTSSNNNQQPKKDRSASVRSSRTSNKGNNNNNNNNKEDETFGYNHNHNGGFSFEEMMAANSKHGIKIDPNFADPNYDPNDPNYDPILKKNYNSNNNKNNNKKNNNHNHNRRDEETFGNNNNHKGWDADDMLKTVLNNKKKNNQNNQNNNNYTQNNQKKPIGKKGKKDKDNSDNESQGSDDMLRLNALNNQKQQQQQSNSQQQMNNIHQIQQQKYKKEIQTTLSQAQQYINQDPYANVNKNDNNMNNNLIKQQQQHYNPAMMHPNMMMMNQPNNQQQQQQQYINPNMYNQYMIPQQQPQQQQYHYHPNMMMMPPQQMYNMNMNMPYMSMHPPYPPYPAAPVYMHNNMNSDTNNMNNDTNNMNNDTNNNSSNNGFKFNMNSIMPDV